jgi:hypothetical protein
MTRAPEFSHRSEVVEARFMTGARFFEVRAKVRRRMQRTRICLEQSTSLHDESFTRPKVVKSAPAM